MSAPTRRQERLDDLLDLARARGADYLHDLEELVSVDSGSYSAEGVNEVADWIERRLERIGFTVERVRLPSPPDGHRTGDALVGRRRGTLPESEGGRRILLAGHMDTVFDNGTAAARPFRIDGSTAYGPGVSDDKGGLLAGLTALEILCDLGADAYDELVLLATPDEEIGSPASRPLIEATAAGVHFGLGLECARENGDLVIARKGVADFRLTVTGRAAHAGIEPERGANAALAAAHLTVALQALNGHWDDVTVNVGVVRAGTRANIVCPRAELRIEVRAATTADIQRVTRAIREAADQPGVPGVTVEVEQLDLCPPMEDTPASRRMFDHARAAARAAGIELGAAATGGVGDANFIAGAGIPVLDGLGPVGGADHTPQEWLDVTSVPQRIALLADLIASLGTAGTT
ncbi:MULTISPECIES: M20 family metallopeptidase [unclassified Streptomyces]|uniref:M20 family metallopeptidase n=1 Tax=unclassified Streptomyces TaxID=2593676 RepID=UPI001661CE31|nr:MULTISPECIES: M20 family metallopeptidase [unclassified Streptomyces]MBD0840666.1 M20 family metallopeptidase [Streptomyces sp. TRM68416]